MKIFQTIIFCFLVLGCKHKVNDYRNKIIGKWHFTYSIVDCPRTYYPPCDTNRGAFDGTIDYQRSSAGDEITLNYSSTQSRVAHISKQGEFTDCGVSGEIIDNNQLTFEWHNSMSCGGGHSSGAVFLTATKSK